MTTIIGNIGFILMTIKIFLHIYLKSKTTTPIPISKLGKFSPPELFIHYFDDAPKGFEWLKTTINILYAIAILCIVIFLIAVNVD
jgi:hypothetical protein